MKVLIALLIAIISLTSFRLIDNAYKCKKSIVFKISSILLSVIFISLFILSSIAIEKAFHNTVNTNLEELFKLFRLDGNGALNLEKIKSSIITRIATLIAIIILLTTFVVKFVSIVLPCNEAKVIYKLMVAIVPVAIVYDINVIPDIVVLSVVIFMIGLALEKLAFSFSKKEMIA